MSEIIDPRMHGFNYGTGWGAEPKPPIYHVAAKKARDLGKRATELNHEAWELEMAVRHVRVACLGSEKAQAVQKLEALMQKYETEEA